ncbi:MAG: Na+/H+ antiporter subunit C [Dehalococcoidia bacterium]|nr:Na+/H+ antiporter subunit C [Dehalococcoidia bacterium]
MEIVLAFVIGVLFAAGTYLLLRRSIVKLVLGVAILSHATNLTIFAAGRLTRAQPPLVPLGETTAPAPAADPLPQALILTAIVIGFGFIAFLIVLLKRTYQTIGADDVDAMRDTEA